MTKATWESIQVDLGSNSKAEVKQHQSSGMWYCSQLTTDGSSLEDCVKKIDKAIGQMQKVLIKRNKVRTIPIKQDNNKKEGDSK